MLPLAQTGVRRGPALLAIATTLYVASSSTNSSLGTSKTLSTKDDHLETLLTDYEIRKQDETRRFVQRAFELENARRIGAECLRRGALSHGREVAERLQLAGHEVVYQELLDSYPPYVRLHLYPKGGPLDLEEPKRWTLELMWGDPDPDRLHARRWTSAGMEDTQELGSLPGVDVDELWVREQFLSFVRTALDLS